MIKRRLLAAVAALLLAGVGAGLLLTYVSGADQRAMAGMETVDVLTVSTLIPEGTSGDALTKRVTSRSLPAKTVVAGTLTSLKQVTGLVATTDLQPGEQLLASRFVDPASLKDPDQIDIPKGMQQVTVPFERARMLGGLLTPGATVGVFVSLAKEGDQAAKTQLMLDGVLVTGVGEPTTQPAPEDAKAEAAAPAESVLVTFAVTAEDAEKIVFGAESARLWLSLQPRDVESIDTGGVTAENVTP